MGIIEICGGPVTHRYLMKKSKSELASLYLDLLKHLGGRPIAAAPKDGTRILLYRPAAPNSRKFGVDFWSQEGGGVWWKTWRDEQPTLWWPLPEVNNDG